MRRFYIDRANIKGSRVFIGGEEAHHIRDVIRLGVGDDFIGIDGSGKSYLLKIIKVSSDSIEAFIEKISKVDIAAPAILLACALPKVGKIDLVIEKATELGVSKIIPMITERTTVRLDDRSRAKRQIRWEKIIKQTAKQCGRAILPELCPVMNFKDAVNESVAQNYSVKIIPAVGDYVYIGRILPEKLEKTAVFIGPEGDFSKKELDYAKSAGFEPVSLGPLVLKVETASIFVLSVLKDHLRI